MIGFPTIKGVSSIVPPGDSEPVYERSRSAWPIRTVEPVTDEAHAPGMAYAIELSNNQWNLVKDVFETKRGRPPRIPRREMVDAMLFLARTGCQWRYLPARYPAWGAVWQLWLRWRATRDPGKREGWRCARPAKAR